MNFLEMLNYLAENKIISFFFGGIGIVMLTAGARFFRHRVRRKKGSESSIASDQNDLTALQKKQLIQNTTKILFVDDHEFPLVNICIDNGWRFTTHIKDVNSLNDKEVLEADIIFVDIHGVGVAMSFNTQGLGLAVAIKKEYPHKIVIIYSADSTGDIFSDEWEKIDGRIPKNADPYVFLEKIQSYAQDIYGK